ncbi:S8 family serine peptidase [Quadrisphaera setariae]|uniref:S8 family serine peptidase n=1 Tax=Quadrisphaera setariae TaxID=2593304 RepID=A0A5C8ZLL1_9ACTN|nr:S8 family serine peptidase [Quadrisphaera setariae]TXR57998.1 S8 family serine peptidase [Quadrisphaera setariae]
MSRRRVLQTASAAVLLLLATSGAASAGPAPEQTYVVSVDDLADVAGAATAADRLGEVLAVHDETGSVVVRTTAARAQRLERLDAATDVEPDALFTPTAETSTPAGDYFTRASTSPASAAVPWHLDRIDQASLPLDGQYRPGGEGAGVTAYVVDTGLRASHAAFTGRVRPGADFSGSGSTSDCNGHGTSVAGALAGRLVGAAPQATLVPLRVSGCAGSARSSSLIAAVAWAVADHPAGAPAVLNVSYGGPPSDGLDRALRAAVADGITVVVAAGNEGSDACGTSPAREPSAITVGASTASDSVAGFSNRGPCVDLLAPGASIVSAGSDSDTSAVVTSGTSLSSPITAGAAAVLLGARPSLSPAQVAAALVAGSSRVASPLAGTTDHLLRTLTTTTADSGSPAAGGPDAVVAVGGQDLISDTSLAALAGGRAVERIAGGDAYATSALLSARAFPDGADHVYLATGTAFADALGAAAAAVGSSAPVLLTRPDAVPASVLAELARLHPATVTATGGPQAISDAVLEQVRQATGAAVVRAAGDDRYATARAVALDALGEAPGGGSGDVAGAAPDTVYLVSGEAFPDALSAAGAAGRSGAPLLLTQAAALPAATAEQLARWRPARVVVVGGPAAVSDEVVRQVLTATGGTATRVAGASRYETAAAVLASGPPPATVWLASGEAYGEALSGAAAAAALGGALVVVPPGGPAGSLRDGVRAALAPR